MGIEGKIDNADMLMAQYLIAAAKCPFLALLETNLGHSFKIRDII